MLNDFTNENVEDKGISAKVRILASAEARGSPGLL